MGIDHQEEEEEEEEEEEGAKSSPLLCGPRPFTPLPLRMNEEEKFARGEVVLLWEEEEEEEEEKGH